MSFIHLDNSNPTQEQILNYLYKNVDDDKKILNYHKPFDIKSELHKKFLKPEICRKLREFARKEFQTETQDIDTVDQELEWQVDISVPILKYFIGTTLYTKLWKITNLLPQKYYFNAFIRRYTTKERKSIKIHFDECTKTININLATVFRGNKLYTISKENHSLLYREHNFELGDLITHDSLLAHGVSPIELGIRYSLIIFFKKRKNPLLEH